MVIRSALIIAVLWSGAPAVLAGDTAPVAKPDPVPTCQSCNARHQRLKTLKGIGLPPLPVDQPQDKESKPKTGS